MENKERKLKKTLISANLLDVEVHHNGYQGGDAGHGGFVKLKLSDAGCTAYSIDVKFDNDTKIEQTHYSDPSGEGLIINQPKSFEMTFMGDCERDTLIEALEFAIKELKENESVKESFESHQG